MSVPGLCAAHDDARSLRLALLDELQRTVGFDAYVWVLTDPETEVGTAPIADVPCLPELPRLIRLKYLTAVNRWTQLTGPVALLRSATNDRPATSPVWRDLQAAYGVTDVASVVFRDRFGCWGFLDLWRVGASFAPADSAPLAEHAGVITTALRRCVARSFVPSSDEEAVGRSGPIVLVLSPDLSVQAQTAETDRYLRALVPPERDNAPVPAAAYNVAAQLLAVEQGIDTHLPRARVHLAGGTWLTLRAARIDSRDGPRQDIAVTIETSSPTERLDLFGRSAGLTAREAELLDLLAGGADTRAVAQRMFVSEHTVQDHLKSIFAKTGTSSRRSLLAQATGR